jgi:metallopeptidase family M12-like protein
VKRALVALALLPALWASLYFGTGRLLSGSTPIASGTEAEVNCGRLLVQPDDGVIFHAASTRVVLALDEEWQARFGEDSVQVARSLLTDAGALFRSVDIHLLPVRFEAWESPDRETSVVELLGVVRESIDYADADIVIALTAQDLRGADGRAEVGGRYALIEHHPEHPERDAFVVAHEVAHLFGATHGCDLVGHEGVLAGSGFDEPGLICPCTRSLLEANAARFHELAEPLEDASR